MQYNYIKFTDGSMEPALNVNAPVGNGGRISLPDDVLLIQGMIALIAQFDKTWVGLDESGDSVPIPTGEVDADIFTAIGQFQIRNKDRLLMAMFDGRIDPAHYKDRHLSHSLRHIMSIMLLHQMATDACVMLGLSTHDPSDELPYRGGLVS